MTLTILLVLQVGLLSALQQTEAYFLSHRHQASLHRRPTLCQWSAAVDETADLIDQETQISASHWDEQFEELQSFTEEYGNCNFPQTASAELNDKYPNLASFCQRQRLDYKRLYHNKAFSSRTRMGLSVFDRDVRCRRLKEIGFEFDEVQAPWYDTYQELVQYHSVNGHLRVPETENPALSQWIIRQRQKRKGAKQNRLLSVTQIDLLDNIGFAWQSERNQDLWTEKYNELVDFRNQHGNLLVDTTGPLYKWMCRQRSTTLTDEQVQLLDGIEFSWKTEHYDATWSAKYNDLERFQKQHRHCLPPTNHELYKWCYRQRNLREEGLVSLERIELLDKINFRWEHSFLHQFPKMFQKLHEYIQKHDHLRVSEEDDPDLYAWMTAQRQRYHGIVKTPPITENQIENLEDVNFCWSLDWRERVWHEMYIEVTEYYKEHGHVRVVEEDNPSLYNWIQTQEKRYKYSKGQKPLSEEELELLEQIDFQFLEDRPRMAWNTRYAQLERYRKESGGCFPNHKDDPDLNLWMRQQRQRMRSSYGHAPLSVEQTSMLESIDFPTLPNLEQRRFWYERYDELVEFQETHGNCVVGAHHHLNAWIDHQRSRYNNEIRRGTRPISKSEVYLLERIGLPWKSERCEIEWQMKYDELVQFQKAHGHCQISRLERPSMKSWMKYQRLRYKGKGFSKLSPHQIKQLEKIGFRWTGKF